MGQTTESSIDDQTRAAAFEEFWSGVSDDDLGRVMDVVQRVTDQGWLVRDVISLLVVPSQHRVGDLWASDSWTVAREHAATALVEAVVRRVGSIRRPRQASTSEPEVLVLCAESEWHSLPSLAVTATLNEGGVKAVYLGADLPAAVVHHEAVRLHTRAVLISASLTSSLPAVRGLIEVVRRAHIPVVVGGSAFDPDGLRAAALGASAHTTHAEELLDLVPRLPGDVSPWAMAATPGVAEADQLHPQRRKLAHQILGRLDHEGHAEPQRTFIAEQLPHVIGSLEAALLVNDPGIVAASRDWLHLTLSARDAASAAEVVWDALGDVVTEFPQASRMLRETDADDGTRWGPSPGAPNE